MGMHKANFGLKTSSLGAVAESFSFAVGAAGAPGAIEQSGANLVASVTRSSAGVYLVQFNAPFWPRYVSGDVQVSPQAANAAARRAAFKAASYDKTLGQITILVSDNTPVAADPANGDVVNCRIVFCQYTNLPS